jgi:hypothetical protein
MKKKSREENADELCPEYDLRHLLRDGIQGKYAQRYQEGTNLVLLAPCERYFAYCELCLFTNTRLIIALTSG